MNKSELLTEIITQMLGDIIRYSLNPDDVLEKLREAEYYLESLNFVVQTNVNCLNFYSDFPELEHLNISCTTYEAKEFFKIRINEIYHDQQIQEQLK